MKPTLLILILATFLIKTTAHAQNASPSSFQTPPDTYENHELISYNLYLVSQRQFKNIRSDQWYGLVDSLGNIVLPCVYRQITRLTDDLIFVQKKAPYFDIYDRTGALIKKTEYIVLPDKTTDNKYVILANPIDRQFALMNQKGEIVTPFKAKLDVALPRYSTYYDLYFSSDYFEQGAAKLVQRKTNFKFADEIYRRYYKLTSATEGERTIHFKRADGEAWQVKQTFKWIRNKQAGFNTSTQAYFYISSFGSVVNINCPTPLFKKLKKDKALLEHEVIYHSYNQYNGQLKAHQYVSKLAELPIIEPSFQKKKERIEAICSAIQQSLELLSDTDFKFMPTITIDLGYQFIHIDFGYMKDHLGKIILTDDAWYFQPNEAILSPDEAEALEDVILIHKMPILDDNDEIKQRSFIVYYGIHKNIWPKRNSFFMKWVEK